MQMLSKMQPFLTIPRFAHGSVVYCIVFLYDSCCSSNANVCCFMILGCASPVWLCHSINIFERVGGWMRMLCVLFVHRDLVRTCFDGCGSMWDL